MSTNDATVTMNGHEVPLQTMLESVQMKPQQSMDRRSVRRHTWVIRNKLRKSPETLALEESSKTPYMGQSSQ